jgi:hypothetical protein
LRCVSKGGRESIRCVHPSRRIAEPVIGRAFARPGGDAPQGEVSILFTNWRASRSDAFQDSMRAKPVPGKELRHAMGFARTQPIQRADNKTELPRNSPGGFPFRQSRECRRRTAGRRSARRMKAAAFSPRPVRRSVNGGHRSPWLSLGMIKPTAWPDHSRRRGRSYRAVRAVGRSSSSSMSSGSAYCTGASPRVATWRGYRTFASLVPVCFRLTLKCQLSP